MDENQQQPFQQHTSHKGPIDAFVKSQFVPHTLPWPRKPVGKSGKGAKGGMKMTQGFSPSRGGRGKKKG